jgi:site-specific DNA-methyltransferase (adenine-specific)
MMSNRVGLFNSSFQDFKRYGIPKAQLILTDIPYSLGDRAYGSNPVWYNGGDNSNGESAFAHESFFVTDENFKPAEFMHFASQMLKPEPKERGKAPCMVVFCEFEQQFYLIELGKRYGFNNYINLVFRKNYSAQVLKANMRVVGATEHAILFYRDKLPKFRNGLQIDENGKNIRGTGHMVFDWFKWEKDGKDIPKIHPSQKPVKLLKKLIETFTDEGDVVIDPCFGSGSTGRACLELNRNFYGFEINKEFYKRAKEEMCVLPKDNQVSIDEYLAESEEKE